MAERDPEFEQEVLKIVYAALADRAALAAAMSGQQPMPVPHAAPEQTNPSTPSRPSPTEVGVQGGAPDPIPPARQFLCGQILHVDYEDLWLGDQETGAEGIEGIMSDTQATRPQVLQELMRRALRAQIAGLRGAVPRKAKPSP
jgi:hypothetical protein